jgi:hypothetical protein
LHLDAAERLEGDRFPDPPAEEEEEEEEEDDDDSFLGMFSGSSIPWISSSLLSLKSSESDILGRASKLRYLRMSNKFWNTDSSQSTTMGSWVVDRFSRREEK